MTLFSIEKAAGLLLMPAGLIWMLLLAAALVRLHRRQWGPAALGLALAALYACAGSLTLAAVLIRGLERRVPAAQVASLEPFDAVFVLGGGTGLDPGGEPQLGPSGDRILLAARLWHAGKARLLVTSGTGPGDHGVPRDQGQETRALWRSVGVPDAAILPVGEPCWNTRQEIKAYARLQARFGWKRTALLSSAAHLPRAMALAARQGLAPTPLGANRMGRARPFQIHELIPQGEGFAITQVACWEYLGRWLGR